MLQSQAFFIFIFIKPWWFSLRGKCPYSEIFWSVFSCIQSEYGEIFRIFSYSVCMREDMGQKHSGYSTFYFPLLLLTVLLWKKYLKTFKFVDLMAVWLKLYAKLTSQKIKFPIKDFFSKYVQIHSFLWIWSYLLNKSLMESFIFCTVFQSGPWLDVGYNNFENVVCCFGAGKLVITAASFIGFTTFANITYLYGRCYYHCILPLTKHKALVPPKTQGLFKFNKEASYLLIVQRNNFEINNTWEKLRV